MKTMKNLYHKGWWLPALIVLGIVLGAFGFSSLKAATPKDSLSKREQISLYKNPVEKEFLYSKTFPTDSFPPCEDVKSDRSPKSFNQSLNRIDWLRKNAGLIARDFLMTSPTIGEEVVANGMKSYGKLIPVIRIKKTSENTVVIEAYVLYHNIGPFSGKKEKPENNTKRYFMVNFDNPNQVTAWALAKTEYEKIKNQ
jgi:hypothetical protein